jgi:hypothetical protein
VLATGALAGVFVLALLANASVGAFAGGEDSAGVDSATADSAGVDSAAADSAGASATGVSAGALASSTFAKTFSPSSGVLNIFASFSELSAISI